LESLALDEPAEVVCQFVEHLRIPLSARLDLGVDYLCWLHPIDRLPTALSIARSSNIISPSMLRFDTTQTVSAWIDWSQAADGIPTTLPDFSLCSSYAYIQNVPEDTGLPNASTQKQLHIPGISLSNIQCLLLTSYDGYKLMEEIFWDVVAQLPRVSTLCLRRHQSPTLELLTG
jgi:hypothetical protein